MYQITARVKLRKHHGNVGRIVLQITVHGDDDLAFRELNAGLHRRRLPVVSAKRYDLDTRHLRQPI